MAAISSKYHLKIGDLGFLLAKQARTERHIYTREEAPAFVNKFSSGEPNYRDSTFFPHWVQLNWLNGFDQEFFDDGGKFYRSSAVDTTQAQKLILEKKFSSAGQTVAGVSVTAQEAWRGSANASVLALDTSANLGSALAASSLTAAYTCSGANRILYVGIFTKLNSDPTDTANDTDRVSGVTYNGVAMTRVSSRVPGRGRVYLYVLVNPTTGSNNIVISTSAAVDIYGVASSYTGAKQTSQPDATDGTSTTNTSITRSVTTVADNCWVISISARKATSSDAISAGAGVTLRQNNNFIAIGDSNGTQTPPGAYSMTWNIASATDISIDLAATAPVSSAQAGSSFVHIAGTSTGKIYSWNDISTYTELFDCRRLEWFESGTDANKNIGDVGGTETAQAQSFQLDGNVTVKGLQVYLKKTTGTPGNITVRIETNNAGVPSGTLANANATSTITAFTTDSYGWVSVEFSTAFQLSGSTVYHIVLKTAAAANDNYYSWAADGSSPGYTDGQMSASTDGGSTWGAVAAADAYFRVLGNATSVNCMLISDLASSTRKLYIGTGDPDGTTNGDARLYSYDGTDFALVKIFNTTNEASIGAMLEFGTSTRKCYIGLGSVAKVYSTTNFSSFTLDKTITTPNNPGYILAMEEYNGKLFVGGGFPESLPGTNNQYNGFLYTYDEYSWTNLFPFDHTVITSMEVFDTLLFIGTIQKRLYVYNTASIDKLIELPWDSQIADMKKWDDKLAIAIAPRPGAAASGHEGIYLFDRNGFHNAFNETSRSWYSVFVFNNNLMGGNDDGYVYKTSSSLYQASGYVQTSYDEAQLPSIEKIRRSVTLMFEALPTGCSILIQYKTDESDSSWTTLGTASTLNSTNETFNFASGIYSKKISYKVTLATSTPANTPTLKKIIHKYVLSPDFKYMWKMKLLCCDEIQWLDGTEPAGLLNADVSANATSITLKSTDDATPTSGFPDPNGSTMYASIINASTGARDRFSYTGKTDTQLTGIPSSGSYAIGAHSANDPVKVTGGDLHQAILTIKQTRQLFTLTDIDGLTYTVFFHSYQSDAWSINMDDFVGGLENEVPITLLEA